MRIVIDLQGMQSESRYRGIGRYTLSLTKGLLRNRGSHEIILALNGFFCETIDLVRHEFSDLLKKEDIRVWYAPGPFCEMREDNNERRQIAEYVRQAFLNSLDADIVLISSLFEGYVDDAVCNIDYTDKKQAVAVVLYDLIPLLNPETYLLEKKYCNFYQRKIESLKHADAWLAISQSAAEEGQTALGSGRYLIKNISTACEEIFQKNSVPDDRAASLLSKNGIYRPFVLYSGGADGRKNLTRLVRAYAALGTEIHKQYQLVFVGRMMPNDISGLRYIARQEGLAEDDLIFTGYVPDKDLVDFYNLCHLFIFPSWHEGFGLPALEAMSCGAVVIGANTSSIPEVIGYPQALFNPFDEADISRLLRLGLQDEVFRHNMIIHAQEQSKKFSWDNTARQAISAFEHLFNNKQMDEAQIITKSEFPQPNLIDKIYHSRKQWQEEELIAISHALALTSQSLISGKHFFIDISNLVRQDAKTGIQRVTRSILLGLLKSPPEGYTVSPVYANIIEPGYRHAYHYLSTLTGIQYPKEEVLIEFSPGDIFLGLDLQHYIVRAQQHYLKFIHRHGVAVHFVVYDLLPILHPQYFDPDLSEIHKEWLSVITLFDSALCISKTVAEELRGWLGQTAPEKLERLKIRWFHLGADIINSSPSTGLPDNAVTVLKNLRENQTFIMVGTVEPRKGYAQTLAAFELLWQQGKIVNLVIIGKPGWMVEPLIKKLRNHPELGHRLFWLEGISDEYLEKIYGYASCLIAASEGEGFGLPLIEAAQHGLPIIARDIPVFREVAGEHAWYFSGSSAQNMANSLSGWLIQFSTGQHPISCRMPWITWEESTRMLLDVLTLKNNEISPIDEIKK